MPQRLVLISLMTACAGAASNTDSGTPDTGDEPAGLEIAGAWSTVGVPLNMDIDELRLEKTWTNGAPADGYEVITWDNDTGTLIVLGDADSFDAGEYLKFSWVVQSDSTWWCESVGYGSQADAEAATDPDASAPSTSGCAMFGGAWWELQPR